MFGMSGLGQNQANLSFVEPMDKVYIDGPCGSKTSIKYT